MRKLSSPLYPTRRKMARHSQRARDSNVGIVEISVAYVCLRVTFIRGFYLSYAYFVPVVLQKFDVCWRGCGKVVFLNEAAFVHRHGVSLFRCFLFSPS